MGDCDYVSLHMHALHRFTSSTRTVQHMLYLCQKFLQPTLIPALVICTPNSDIFRLITRVRVRSVALWR